MGNSCNPFSFVSEHKPFGGTSGNRGIQIMIKKKEYKAKQEMKKNCDINTGASYNLLPCNYVYFLLRYFTFGWIFLIHAG